MKKNVMRVVSAVTVSVLALMFTSSARAQITVWPIQDGIVVSDFNPISNPPLGDNCQYLCAQEFSIGSSGAYVDQLDMDLILANPTAFDIPCSPSIAIRTVQPNGAPGFYLFSKNEALVLPPNGGNYIPLKLHESFPTLWLPPGNYYLQLNNENGNTCTYEPALGIYSSLDWDLNVNGSKPVGTVGPAYGLMFAPSPSQYSIVGGTFAFDLLGPILLPPVGGGKFERSRLVVAGPVTPPPGGPVQFQVGFLNAETGALLAPLQQLTLNPGQIESADLNLTPLVARVGQRIEVQPVIVQSPGAVNPGPISISATVQTLDELTGFEAVLESVPQPGASSPGLGPQILAGGQTMRMDVLASGVDPCVAQVQFNDANGNPLIPASSANLTPGTGTIVDLNSEALGLRLGQNIEVQPVVTPTAPAAAVAQNSVCNASVEVFDHLTGRTWSHQSTFVGLPAVQTPAAGSSTPGGPAAGLQ
jgi:hypothetical protein